jgi:hypothetical protein
MKENMLHTKQSKNEQVQYALLILEFGSGLIRVPDLPFWFDA